MKTTLVLPRSFLFFFCHRYMTIITIVEFNRLVPANPFQV
jgi:hypothetical protein